VYLLFEHQSTPDAWMPLRLLRYQTRIWERHVAENPDDLRLPPIVPLLLHHGPKPWPWEPTFARVLALDGRARAAFGRRLLDFEFLLDDLAAQTDQQILDRASDAIARLTLIALRNSRMEPRLLEHVLEVMQALASELRGPAVVPALARLARYVLEVGDSPPEVIRSAFAAALPPEIRSSVMSTADMLRAEGRVEGRLEGRLEGRREMLLEQLEIKFGSLDTATRTRVESATHEQVIAWLRRFAVASTLDEVFAG
jgi:predicted transposase YdaD